MYYVKTNSYIYQYHKRRERKVHKTNFLQKAMTQLKVNQTQQNLNLTKTNKFIYEISSQYVDKEKKRTSLLWETFNQQETAKDGVAGLQSGNKIWENWLRTSLNPMVNLRYCMTLKFEWTKSRSQKVATKF